MELRKDHDGRGYVRECVRGHEARLVARPASRGITCRGNHSPKPRTARKKNTISDNNVKSIRYHFFLYASVEIDLNNFACAIVTG